ncbi:phage holin family protein [Brevibacillus choshinensis]|uniref:phage holin family protein n=1 Tax=Brevibacillus choshinensis TaxID=54911 RepID=UPI002E20E66C|nr:phage holin family protein [Brevibacillus choshinensis]MED4754711.1 phage holin family protein [Brevibacillus choshinensis]MED4780450.1 phage holin family protein [Brevibacillus choshinensis]
MIRWIIKLLLNGAALILISNWFQSIQVSSFGVAVWAALILGIVNTLIRPVLTLFTLPLSFLTLGLFWFVINAITFSLTAFFINGFEVGPWPDNIGIVIIASALMSLLGWLIDLVVSKPKK